MTQKEVNKSSKQFKGIFDKSQLEVIAILLALEKFTVTEKDEALVAIAYVLKSLTEKSDSWLARNIKKYYSVGATETAQTIHKTTIFSPQDKQIITNLITQATTSMDDAITGIHRSSSKLISKAIEDKIKMKIAEGKVEGEALKQLADSVASTLAKKGIYLVDSAGRKWDISNYSELYARTEIMNTYNNGVVNQMYEHGWDLGYITEYASCECDACRAWQGKIVSISGKDKRYPALEDAYSDGVFHPNCYSKDTEVYTDNGWKLFKDVNGERIMSINPTTQEMEWVNYINKISYKYKGELLAFKDNSFDLLVTPDHIMYAGTKSHKNGKAVVNWQLMEAKEAVKKTHRQLRIPKWKGKSIKSPISSLSIMQYAFLLGAYLSEGCIDNNKVCICQNEYRKERFAQELNEMGFYYNRSRFIKTDREMSEHFKQFGKSWEKYIPNFFLQAKTELLEEFLRGFILGDGSTRDSEYKGFISHEEIALTSSDRLAGQLGEVILKVGKYPSFTKPPKPRFIKFQNGRYMQKHTCWTIRINSSKTSYFNLSPSIAHRGIQVEEVDYDDYVYDIELDKNHILLVRRNGKIAWSGNCNHRVRPYLG